MEKLFSEQIRVENAGILGDIAGGVETDRLDLSKSNKVSIVVKLAAGAGTTFSMTLKQHDLAAAGTSVDLVSSVPVYQKQDADAAFTRFDGSTATIASANVDTAAGVVVVEVHQDDLAEGNRYVSLVLASPGAARVASVDYMIDTKNKPAYQIEY